MSQRSIPENAGKNSSAQQRGVRRHTPCGYMYGFTLATKKNCPEHSCCRLQSNESKANQLGTWDSRKDASHQSGIWKWWSEHIALEKVDSCIREGGAAIWECKDDFLMDVATAGIQSAAVKLGVKVVCKVIAACLESEVRRPVAICKRNNGKRVLEECDITGTASAKRPKKF